MYFSFIKYCFLFLFWNKWRNCVIHTSCVFGSNYSQSCGFLPPAYTSFIWLSIQPVLPHSGSWSGLRLEQQSANSWPIGTSWRKTATGTRLLKWFVFFAVFCISLAQWDMNNMADVSKAISSISLSKFHSNFTYFCPNGLIRSKSSLAQVMAWRPTVGGMIYRHQAIHYLNQIDLSAMRLVTFRG